MYKYRGLIYFLKLMMFVVLVILAIKGKMLAYGIMLIFIAVLYAAESVAYKWNERRDWAWGIAAIFCIIVIGIVIIVITLVA